MRDKPRAARVALDFNFDIQPIRRPLITKPLGPLDHGGSLAQGLVQSDLERLRRVGQAIEIEMRDGKIRPIVKLYKGEGRARYIALSRQ